MYACLGLLDSTCFDRYTGEIEQDHRRDYRRYTGDRSAGIVDRLFFFRRRRISHDEFTTGLIMGLISTFGFAIATWLAVRAGMKLGPHYVD